MSAVQGSVGHALVLRAVPSVSQTPVPNPFAQRANLIVELFTNRLRNEKDGYVSPMEDHRQAIRRLIAKVRTTLVQSKSVLDVSCGPGLQLLDFGMLTPDSSRDLVVANDLTPAMTERAASELSALPPLAQDVRFTNYDVLAGFPEEFNNLFDLIFIAQTLNFADHVEGGAPGGSLKRFLKNAWACLAPNGLLAVFEETKALLDLTKVPDLRNREIYQLVYSLSVTPARIDSAMGCISGVNTLMSRYTEEVDAAHTAQNSRMAVSIFQK